MGVDRNMAKRLPMKRVPWSPPPKYLERSKLAEIIKEHEHIEHMILLLENNHYTSLEAIEKGCGHGNLRDLAEQLSEMGAFEKRHDKYYIQGPLYTSALWLAKTKLNMY